MANTPERTPLQEEFYPVLDVTTLLIDDEKTVALVVLQGINNRTINWGSDTTYHVISGDGFMSFPETGTKHRLLPGIRITVPKGLAYQDRGDLVMLATSTPPFNLEQVEEL